MGLQNQYLQYTEFDDTWWDLKKSCQSQLKSAKIDVELFQGLNNWKLSCMNRRIGMVQNYIYFRERLKG